MKKNIFAETYSQVQELKKAYDAAADEAGKEKARAGYHALMEAIVLFFRLKEHPICRLFSTKRNPV